MPRRLNLKKRPLPDRWMPKSVRSRATGDAGFVTRMRTIIFLVGLYILHRLLLHASPSYSAYMRRLDRQVTWLNILLVVYLAVSFCLRLVQYLSDKE